jgi:hypothetical protein
MYQVISNKRNGATGTFVNRRSALFWTPIWNYVTLHYHQWSFNQYYVASKQNKDKWVWNDKSSSIWDKLFLKFDQFYSPYLQIPF